ncbi:MAG: permease [Phycisphaerales bacterium]|nr:permease [Phycisphaerales bacterium]
MSKTNSAVAVFSRREQAEQAIRKLEGAGIDIRRMSLIGRDVHSEQHVVGYYTTGDRMMAWGANGAFWGGIWGLLFGSAFFWIPGLGPLMIAGPVVAWIVGALEGAVVVGGLSALGAALYSIGIPRDSILQYETAIKADKIVLVVDGTPEDVKRAEQVLAGTPAIRTQTHLAGAAMPAHA